jgi:hypothetical protein
LLLATHTQPQLTGSRAKLKTFILEVTPSLFQPTQIQQIKMQSTPSPSCEKAANSAYLPLNSQSMQKTIEGVRSYWRFPQPKAWRKKAASPQNYLNFLYKVGLAKIANRAARLQRCTLTVPPFCLGSEVAYCLCLL